MGLTKYLISGLFGRSLDATTPWAQDFTNGKSVYGTLLAPLLPSFLLDNPLPHGYPWGNRTDCGSNPYRDYPTTGVTRNYDFTISRGVLAPDGYQRDVLLVNGAFPGPTIEANWGDKIVITVHNNITDPEEGTTVHWHGFLQTDTPWQDGIPGVTQCPIAPGKTFTYEIQATLYGTSWYHAHYSGQYADGIVGPIVIYGPSKFEHAIDVGPILLSDWYHHDYLSLVKKMLAPGGNPEVYSDNTLINGKMNFDCSTVAAGDKTPCNSNAGISKFKFRTGQTHRLRLINSGAAGDHRFSIDDHTMTVIALDFVPVVPFDTKAVVLGIGQRADVLVKANAGSPKSSFWIRSTQTRCSLAKQPRALAALYYDGADTETLPTSKGWDLSDHDSCTDAPLEMTQPLFPIPLPNPSVTKTMDIGLFVNESDVTLWTFDEQEFRVNYNAPPLLLANAGNFSYPKEWNVKNFGTNSSVRIVMNNHSPAPHPMHIHGYNFYVLHEGPGPWDGKTVIRPRNPMRRDVALVRPGGHLVVQFDGNNPGVWPLHCHTAWHASGGFFASLLVQPALVERYRIPGTIAQTCRDWGAWTRTHVPDQIDSGQ